MAVENSTKVEKLRKGGIEMKCDKCGEYATGQVYPVYNRETGENTFLCYHCWYDIVERESDIEYKKMLREIADECHNRRKTQK